MAMEDQALHRRRIKALAASPLDLHSLFGQLSRAVTDAVPADTCSWLVYDPDTLLPIDLWSNSGRAPDLQLEYCRNEQLEEDFNQYRRLAVGHRPVSTLDRATDGRPARSRRYRDLLEPFGLRRELRMSLRAGGLCWGSLTLQRGSGSRDFSAFEMAYLGSLNRALARGLRTRIVEREGVAAGAEPPGVVVLDRDGRLASMTPAAASWLALLRDADQDGVRELPWQLTALALRARAGAPSVRMRVPLATGGWISLFGAGSTDPADGTVTVVVEQARPSDLLPLLAQAHGLSSREQEVVRLVLQGHSTASISGRLAVSENTVQDHLKSVFRKTGVSSRRELSYKLALEEL